MHIRLLSSPAEYTTYNQWVHSHPQGNLWQSLAWKQYQETLGRTIRIYVAEGASALVVIDRTTGGYSTWDIPRGPLWDSQIPTNLLNTIVSDARKDGCFSLYLSPQQPLPPTPYSLQPSIRHEQPTATRIIDLTQSEEAILAHMHPKGRYNIHVAQKNGVRVEQSRDVEAFYSLLQETAKRDGFHTLPLKAYKAFLESLSGSFLLMAYGPPSPDPFPVVAPTPGPSPLLGRGEPPLSRSTGEGAGGWGRLGMGQGVVGGGGKPVAGLLGVMWPNLPLPRPLSRCGRRGETVTSPTTGIYYYGASDYASRSLMAPYALQWEAMRLCKARGCTTYDLLGITPPLVTLRCEPSEPRSATKCHGSWLGSGLTPHHDTAGQRHPWAGVSAFKEKFGGTIITYPPEQQIILQPLLWKALQWKRRIVG